MPDVRMANGDAGGVFMDRPRQFSIGQLFKAVCGFAFALAALRWFGLGSGDDGYVLPALGMIVGLLIGLPFRRAGEGAVIGFLALICFGYVCAQLNAPR